MGILYEQPGHEPVDFSDDDEPLPESDLSRSYHLFFVAPNDPRFRSQGEDDEEDEEGRMCKVSEERTVGCVVAISEIAPVGVVGFDSFYQSETGSHSLPEPSNDIF